jgi:tetratricopeptide (TPR) repeat protein
MNDRLIGAIDPDVARGGEVTVSRVVEQALAALDAEAPEEPEVEFELRLTLSVLLSRLGRQAEGLRQAEIAERLASKVYGEASLEVARALHVQAGQGRSLGLGAVDPDRAVEVMERCYVIRQRLLPPQHPELLRTAADLEVVRNSAAGVMAGGLDQASLLLMAFVRGKGESTKEVQAVVDATLVAVVRADATGNREELRRIIVEAVEPYSKHSLTRERLVLAVGGYALNLAIKGQHGPARAVARAAHELALHRSETPTSEHAVARYFLANVAMAALDLRAAEEHWLEGLKVGDRLGVKDHTWVATALEGLGQVKYKAGEYRASEEYFSRSLAMFERLNPEGDINVARSLDGLGAALRRQGRHAEAIVALTRGYELSQRVSPLRNADLAETVFMIGESLLELGEAEAAVTYLREAVQLGEGLRGFWTPERRMQWRGALERAEAEAKGVGGERK